jgi:hypothetical protein
MNYVIETNDYLNVHEIFVRTIVYTSIHCLGNMQAITDIRKQSANF